MSLIPFGFFRSTYQVLPSGDFPTYGWSFWKRNPNYTGACIRVWRNSDNTTQDIGFKNNYLDTAALLSFVGGSGNGGVTIFYDQFGSINLTDQVYPASTYGITYIPVIVSAGQLITFKNGEAAMQFGDKLLFGGSGTTMAANTNSTFIWTEENSSTLSNLLAGNNNGNSVFAGRAFNNDLGNLVFFDIASYTNYIINGAIDILGGDNNQQLATSLDLYESSSYRTAQDGAKLIGFAGVGYNSLGTGFSIGARGNGTLTNSFAGKLNEMFIYNGTTLTYSKVKEIEGVLNASHGFYNTTSVSYKLVLWYDAGNTSSYPGSGTTITDLSVGGANGTLQNGTTYSSADGGKFVLDGVNDWINTTGTTNYPWNIRASDVSLEVWVKFSNANQTGVIFTNRNSSTGSMLSLYAGTIDTNGNITSSKKISFSVSNSDTTRVKWYATVDDILDGNWKHIIAVRYEGYLMKVYVNGVEKSLSLVNTVGGSNPSFVKSLTTWRVGDNGSGAGGFGAFDISIIRMYICALDQTQVTRNFNLEKSRYGL